MTHLCPVCGLPASDKILSSVGTVVTANLIDSLNHIWITRWSVA